MEMHEKSELLKKKKIVKIRPISTLSELQQSNKLIIALYLTVIASIGATTIFFFKTSISQKDTVKTAKHLSDDVVTALDRIEPRKRIIQLAPALRSNKVKVSQLLVAEGDRITKGQTIALLDNYRSANAVVELARQEVEVTQANLAIVKAEAKRNIDRLKRIKIQLEEEIAANEAEVLRLETQLLTEQTEKQAEIERRRTELRNTENKFKRYQQLAREEVISESKLSFDRLMADKAQNALLEAQSSYNYTTSTRQKQINQAKAIARLSKDALQKQIIEAEATLDSIDGTREVDVIKAQAEVNKAIAALRQAEKDLEHSYVKAPTDGRVIKIHAYPGEIINKDGIVEFAQTNGMIAIAEVYKRDIERVKIGQNATIRSETGAFAGEIEGKVSQIGLKTDKQDVINTAPAVKTDSRTVEVEIHLNPQSNARLTHLTDCKAIVKISQ